EAVSSSENDVPQSRMQTWRQCSSSFARYLLISSLECSETRRCEQYGVLLHCRYLSLFVAICRYLSLFVVICRLSLFFANGNFEQFHNCAASLSRGIARDDVGCRKLLFLHFLQSGQRISASPEVSFHGFLDLLKLLRPASAGSRGCFRLQHAAGLIRTPRPTLRTMRIG